MGPGDTKRKLENAAMFALLAFDADIHNRAGPSSTLAAHDNFEIELS